MLPPHLQETFNRAFKHHSEGRLDEAVAIYRQLLDFNPQEADVLQLLGTVYLQKGDHRGAIEYLQLSLDLVPGQPRVRENLAQAWLMRGVARQADGDIPEAVEGYNRALALDPKRIEAVSNLGVISLNSGKWEEALTYFRRAIAINPAFADAHVNIAATLSAMHRYREALPAYRLALALKPDSPFFKGTYVHTKQHVCDWQNLPRDFADLLSDVDAGKPVATPFSLLATPATPAQLQRGATVFAAMRHPSTGASVWSGARHEHEKIRIGYFSPDFYDHATARLLAGVIEAHDRDRFAIVGFTWGPFELDDTRKRLEKAFGGLIDLNPVNDHGAASTARRMQIGIAVDLSGYVQMSRAGIFARRAAPVQVNYLGFPGTMGADYFDYLIADRMIVPPQHHAFYTEKIVTLPDSYQANDSRRAASARVFTRSDLGLPDKGFVFASFNNSYKITPDIFDIWMRLLINVPGSVLWLLQSDDLAVENLKREAGARGVAPERLVFAPPMPAPDHLARHVHADLFLDTFFCNGHTTTSDALWMGGAVVACKGITFAGRVSSSLLMALGVPELITTSVADYERLALELARDSTRLAAIKAKIAANRTTFPLFDTVRFTRHLEAAYTEMWARHQRGEAPSALTIQPLSS